MSTEQTLLWWLIPGKLGGMSMPFFHPDRRAGMAGSSAKVYDDDLPVLAALGIRAVASLLNIPGDKSIYAAAGIDFLCLPLADGTPPTALQARKFIQFVDEHQSRNEAVAVHCAAGLGRTGTMLAAYLIGKGSTAPEAIRKVRQAQPGAIETRSQVEFLHAFAGEMGHSHYD